MRALVGLLLVAACGGANFVLQKFSIKPVNWLANPLYAMMSVILLDVWQGTLFTFIVILAGLQSLPLEPYESAKIDGANSWQILKSITVPLVMPAVTICTFLTVTNSFKLFDQNLALTAGAPARASSMLATRYFQYFLWAYGL